MIYRCYVYKGTNDASDFESNHKDTAIEVDKVIFGTSAVDFLKNVSYTDFKSYIDGEVNKWEDVKFKDAGEFYELWLEVE